MTRSENKCMHACFHKYYRHLAYSNSLYTFLIADDDMEKQITQNIRENYEDEGEPDMSQAEAFQKRQQMQEESRNLANK